MRITIDTTKIAKVVKEVSIGAGNKAIDIACSTANKLKKTASIWFPSSFKKKA